VLAREGAGQKPDECLSMLAPSAQGELSFVK